MGIELLIEFDGMKLRKMGIEKEGFFNELVEVKDSEFHFGVAREGEEIRNDPADPSCLRLHKLQILAELVQFLLLYRPFSQNPVHQHGQVENSRNGVVVFVY